MFTPGITGDHIKFLNYIFLLLFIFLLFTIVTSAGSDEPNLHIYVLTVLSFGLFAAMQWFIANYQDVNEKKKQ